MSIIARLSDLLHERRMTLTELSENSGITLVNLSILKNAKDSAAMVGGIGWLTWLWPPLGSRVFMGLPLFAIVGVIATCGWLFIRGVDDAKWRERAALAATSVWR